MMSLKGLTHTCLRCGRIVIPYSIPYGLAWVCVCGRWTTVFRFGEKRIEFQIGDEELALEYIAKIGQMLG